MSPTSSQPCSPYQIDGTEVVGVTPGGWAERSGVLLEDELYAINDEPYLAMDPHKKVVALMGNYPMKLTFKRPIVRDITMEIFLNAKKMGVTTRGTIITKIERGSWARRVGLLVGDELVEVDHTSFRHSLGAGARNSLFARPRPLRVLVKRTAETILNRLREGKGIMVTREELDEMTEKVRGFFGQFL